MSEISCKLFFNILHIICFQGSPSPGLSASLYAKKIFPGEGIGVRALYGYLFIASRNSFIIINDSFIASAKSFIIKSKSFQASNGLFITSDKLFIIKT